MSDFYQLCPLDTRGNPYPFSQLEGKVVLIVNTASGCSYTKQLASLQKLYQKYKDQGLVILAFPSDQFHQEPGTDAEIAEFCETNFGIEFPVMKKVDINGSDNDPVYAYLKSQKKGLLGFSGIKWNFEKFLVDRKGTVTNRWPSTTPPDAIENVVVRLLERSQEGH